MWFVFCKKFPLSYKFVQTLYYVLTPKNARAEEKTPLNDRKPTAGLALFLAASIVTFGCLTVLQFLDKPWFFVALVAMHVGIALFVASKRTLCKQGFALMGYFKTEYLMLVPFVLIMLYSFASKASLVPLFGTAKASITLVYALVCFAVAFWNFRRMQADAAARSASNDRAPIATAPSDRIFSPASSDDPLPDMPQGAVAE